MGSGQSFLEPRARYLWLYPLTKRLWVQEYSQSMEPFAVKEP